MTKNMNTLMGTTYDITRTAAAITAKIKGKQSIELKLKNDVTVLIGRGGYGPEEYSLYLGCELVVGDVPINTVAKLVCQIASDTKENLRNEFGYFAISDEEEQDTRSSTTGDYSPSNPWDAPGMSPKDFI